MATNTGEQTLAKKKNTVLLFKTAEGFLHCLLLGLTLPRGKEPFNPISLLGARQRAPASTCVSGAAFAVRSPSCSSQLSFCLRAHLRKGMALACLTASR